MMFWSLVIVLVVCIAESAAIQKRSTTTQSEISVLRGLVAKISSETEATRISVTSVNANINTVKSKLDAQTVEVNSRIEKLSKVTQEGQQCDINGIDSYVRYATVDCSGNDITSFYQSSISLQGCITRCNNVRLCKAFYYKGSSSECFIKSKCDLTTLGQPSSGAGDTYIKKAVSFYDHIKGFNCGGGNDIRHFPNTNPEKCTQQCNNDILCVAVIQDATTCWLKKKCESGRITRNPSADIYIHNDRRDIPGFVRKPNDHCPGNDLWSHHVNAEDCAMFCKTNSNCIAIEFWHQTGLCHHKSACGSPRYWKGETVVYDKQ